MEVRGMWRAHAASSHRDQGVGRVARKPWIAGAAAFFLSLFVLGRLLGSPVTCRDGWHSPAIGKRGACSHHGGVDRSGGSLIFLVSLGIGLTVGCMLANWRDRNLGGTPAPSGGWSAPRGHTTGYIRVDTELPSDRLARLKAENAAAAQASEEFVRQELKRLDAEREARRLRPPAPDTPKRKRTATAKRRTPRKKQPARTHLPEWLR